MRVYFGSMAKTGAWKDIQIDFDTTFYLIFFKNRGCINIFDLIFDTAIFCLLALRKNMVQKVISPYLANLYFHLDKIRLVFGK